MNDIDLLIVREGKKLYDWIKKKEIKKTKGVHCTGLRSLSRRSYK
jgi:hypothetical protein